MTTLADLCQIATLAFLNSGQICLAIKRIYVHESIHDEFLKAMVEVTKSLKVGEGNEEGVFLGPIQNKMQYEKVKVRLQAYYGGNHRLVSNTNTMLGILLRHREGEADCRRRWNEPRQAWLLHYPYHH